MNITTLFSLPDPEQDTMRLRKIEGGIAAVLKFGGNPTEEVVQQKVKELQYNLKKDGLKPIINGSYLLAQYNDPRRTWSFVMVSPKTICLSAQVIASFTSCLIAY